MESLHTFHVLEFLFLSFAPGRDGPIRYSDEVSGMVFHFSFFLVVGALLFGSHA